MMACVAMTFGVEEALLWTARVITIIPLDSMSLHLTREDFGVIA